MCCQTDVVRPAADDDFEINNAQTYNAKNIDVVMLMHNLIEYNENHLKISGSLWQYYRDEPALNANGALLILLMLVIIVLRLNLMPD